MRGLKEVLLVSALAGVPAAAFGQCATCGALPPVANASAATVNNNTVTGAGKTSWWPLFLLGGGAGSVPPSPGSEFALSSGATHVGFGPFSYGNAPPARVSNELMEFALARQQLGAVTGNPLATPEEKVVAYGFAGNVVPVFGKTLSETARIFSSKDRPLTPDQDKEGFHGEEQEDGSRVVSVRDNVASAYQLFGTAAVGTPPGATNKAGDSGQGQCVVVAFDEVDKTTTAGAGGARKRLSVRMPASACGPAPGK